LHFGQVIVTPPGGIREAGSEPDAPQARQVTGTFSSGDNGDETATGPTFEATFF
jgi:hypothetical protein